VCNRCRQSHIAFTDKGQPLHRLCPAELAARYRRRGEAVAARERLLASLPKHVQGRTGADCAGCVAEGHSRPPY
jgi:hypothetical protein